MPDYRIRKDKGFTTDVMKGDRYIATFVTRKEALFAVAALNAYVNSQERNANSSTTMGQAPASILEENVLEKRKEKE